MDRRARQPVRRRGHRVGRHRLGDRPRGRRLAASRPRRWASARSSRPTRASTAATPAARCSTPPVRSSASRSRPAIGPASCRSRSRSTASREVARRAPRLRHRSRAAGSASKVKPVTAELAPAARPARSRAARCVTEVEAGSPAARAGAPRRRRDPQVGRRARSITARCRGSSRRRRSASAIAVAVWRNRRRDRRRGRDREDARVTSCSSELRPRAEPRGERRVADSRVAEVRVADHRVDVSTPSGRSPWPRSGPRRCRPTIGFAFCRCRAEVRRVGSSTPNVPWRL